jgi:hypothetical protein
MRLMQCDEGSSRADRAFIVKDEVGNGAGKSEKKTEKKECILKLVSHVESSASTHV